MFSGCEEKSGDDAIASGDIIITVSKEFILSNGNDATTISVMQLLQNGSYKDVTADSDIYMNNSSQPLSSNVLSVDKPGEYVCYALYDLNISKEVTIYAYDSLPEAPEDPQPSKTSFHHRLMLVQHTGTGCVNCPRMMDSLRSLAADDAYNSAYTHVACHSYESTPADPCASEAASNFSRIYCSGYYPELTFNFTKTSTGTDLNEIKAQVDALREDHANVGIAAEAIVCGGDLLVNVEVKVAATGDYRLGVWVLEDDIYGLQTGASNASYNTHENALRAMVTNSGSMTNFVGETLEDLKSSKVVSKSFRISCQDNWKADNCKFLLFVTAPGKNGDYDLLNSVVCGIGDSIEYDYI